MRKILAALVVLEVTDTFAPSHGVCAQQPAGDVPRYASGTSLVRPAEDPERIFLSSGLDMT